MRVFDIDVTRDGRWWMVSVPELDGYVSPDGSVNLSTVTQARSRREVDVVARDFIAVILGLPTADIAVRWR